MRKKPLGINHIKAMIVLLENKQDYRMLALIGVGYDSALRVSDILNLRLRDILRSDGSIQDELTIIQKKTQTPVTFVLSEKTRAYIKQYLGEDAQPTMSKLFNFTPTWARRLLADCCTSIGLDRKEYGFHSLRRAKTSQIYKNTRNLRLCQLILGHKNINYTSRYLGIEEQDALEASREYNF